MGLVMKSLEEKIRAHPQGVVLWGFSSTLLAFAREYAKGKLTLPIQGLSFGGEAMRESERAEIEEAVGARVYSSYAAAELGRIAFECEARRVHVSEEHAWIEIVDTKGRPVAAGETGQVLVTLFDNPVMPFIRYAG